MLLCCIDEYEITKNAKILMDSLSPMKRQCSADCYWGLFSGLLYKYGLKAGISWLPKISFKNGLGSNQANIIFLALVCSSSYLKHADLDVHWKGVELHRADEGDPGGQGVHQLQFEM